MTPAISVLMPVFNCERYLRAALDSVLVQSFRDFELLVLDDGSTDATGAVLSDYARRDARVTVISRSNKGLAASLNELLPHARAPLVARMDGDDVCLPERFALQRQFLSAHPEVVCVGGSVELIDEAARFLTTLRYLTGDAEIQTQALAGHGTIAHSAAMIRREALIRIGGYDTRYRFVEDLDLWLRLGEIGRLANLEQAVLRVRLHSRSVSEMNARAQRQEGRYACEQAWRRRGIQGTYEASAPWRAGPDPASRHEIMLRYGWWAFGSRQRRTALLYGLRAVRALPRAQQGWKLLLCALCKPG